MIVWGGMGNGMFAVFRLHKKRIVAVLTTLLLAACSVAMALAFTTGQAEATTVTVAIDPGHGGYDGGVSGLVTHVKESDVNLSIALYLATYLRGKGYRVVLTRDRDRAPVEAGALKRRDMDMRLATARNAATDILVSIHCNFYPSAYRRGIQVFYGKEADIPLAERIQATLNDTCNLPDVGRGFSPLWGDYYLLSHAHCPAVIVECGFLSNREDEALLTDAAYRMTLAYHIFSAIDADYGEDAAAIAW